MYPENLQSVQLEKNFLGGIINHPEVLVDLENIISDKEFSNKVHTCIFSVLKNIVLSGQKIDKTILAQRIKDLGISFNHEISIFDYIDDISFTQVQSSGIKEITQELVKLRIRRDIYDNASAIQKYINSANGNPIDEIIHHVDALYHEQLGQYSTENGAVDLYSSVESFITEIARNPVEEVGLKTEFTEWNRLFGGLRTGVAGYNIVSRAGEGKSAFLFNMAKGVSRLNNIKTLYIDTEMDLKMQMFRAAAAESEVNAWYLETGQWIKNQDLAKKVLKGFEKLNQYKGHVYHVHFPNKDIQETLSFIRRWYYKYVGRGNPALIVYDYLKITSDFDKNRAEYQTMGDKVSYLNELNTQLGTCLFMAAQQNRSGEQNGVRNDDSTTVSISDRINMYVSFNAVFRKKMLEEIADHGTQFGTHLLKPFKTSRVQGKDNYNVNSFVKTINPQGGKVVYKQNFINYEIKEYGLYEKGTLADVVKNQQLNANLQKNTKEHNHNNI